MDVERAPIDLWADVPFDHLPLPLVDAFGRKDWVAVRRELRQVMDGVVTDGVYGRELLKLVLQLPIGIDPLFDRYRGMVSCDFGDWDGLQRCLDMGDPTDRSEISGLRDIMLAPVSQTAPPEAQERHHAVFFRVYEAQFAQLPREYLRWAEEIQHYRPAHLWARGDMPMTRHVRYRQFHDALGMAIGESQAGRLPVALSFALEAVEIGDRAEPFHVVAGDVERLIGAAMGDVLPEQLGTWDMVRRPTGASPLATWQVSTYLFHLAAATRLPDFDWMAELVERVAVGLGSPRALLAAQSWKVAAHFVLGNERRWRELPSLVATAQSAAPGLRVLPQLLNAIAEQQPDEFVRAERLARRVRNVWAQISALAWLTALEPKLQYARRLAQLLTVTGWRRLVLVPPGTAGEAALGLVSLGVRGRAVIELGSVAGRPNVAIEVARRHVQEPGVARDDKFHALDALAAIGAPHAQDLLRRIAQRRDEVGQRAAALIGRPSHPVGLSDREIEVVDLAGKGMTNREIAGRIGLSPHTVARHLANARAKLRASNRTEAAIRLSSARDIEIKVVPSGSRTAAPD
jgi:DNA-binding CsgD family transcriptional regulator